MQFEIDNKIGASKVLKNPFKDAPGIRINAIFSTTALITKENNPIVRNVIGNDNNFNTGLTKTFSKPKITANAIKIGKELIIMPSKNCDTIQSDATLATKLIDNFFISPPVLVFIIRLFKKRNYPFDIQFSK